MHSYRFIQLLKLLSPDELDQFGRFLASPYFNVREKPQQLLDICKAYHPLYDSNKLQKQKLFARLYPNEYRPLGRVTPDKGSIGTCGTTQPKPCPDIQMYYHAAHCLSGNGGEYFQ